jgi:hypothetical protein
MVPFPRDLNLNHQILYFKLKLGRLKDEIVDYL